MSAPRIDLLTLFPAAVEAFLDAGILGSARRDGIVEVVVTALRDFAARDESTGVPRRVDDAPYGGGDGMVLRCEPVVAALEAVVAGRTDPRLVVMSPRGRILDRDGVLELTHEVRSGRPLLLLAGRYAGFDERILEETGAEELSIGDYVLSGGELAALVVIEAVTRRLPGVLGNPLSSDQDSFEGGLLEHPLYTRPAEFRGRNVPDVLLSGDHAAIERARRRAALELTLERRPDLLATAERMGALSNDDLAVLRGLREGGMQRDGARRGGTRGGGPGPHNADEHETDDTERDP